MPFSKIVLTYLQSSLVRQPCSAAVIFGAKTKVWVILNREVFVLCCVIFPGTKKNSVSCIWHEIIYTWGDTLFRNHHAEFLRDSWGASVRRRKEAAMLMPLSPPTHTWREAADADRTYEASYGQPIPKLSDAERRNSIKIATTASCVCCASCWSHAGERGHSSTCLRPQALL